MKFKGDDVSTLGVWPEAAEGWWDMGGGGDEARTGLTPLPDMDGASAAGFRGTQVSWIPAGMARISLPCWTLRYGLPPRRRLPAAVNKQEGNNIHWITSLQLWMHWW